MRLVPKIAAGTRLLRCVLSLQPHLPPPLWTISLPPELQSNMGALSSSFLFGKLSLKPLLLSIKGHFPQITTTPEVSFLLQKPDSCEIKGT